MWKVILSILIWFTISGCSSMNSKVIIGDDYNLLSEKISGNNTFILFPYLYLHFDYDKKMNLINNLLKNPNDYLNVLKSSEFYDRNINISFTQPIFNRDALRDLTKYHNYCFHKSDLNNIMIFHKDADSISLYHKMGFYEKKFHSGISFWFVHKKGKWYLTGIGLSNTEEFESE